MSLPVTLGLETGLKTDITMKPAEGFTIYHPIVGEIEDVVLGPDNFHRLRITKPQNDFFVTGDGFADIQDTPGFFPIVYFYKRLLEHSKNCFGTSEINGISIYNYDDISRLGLEFYIYYVLDYSSESTVEDISIFALFVVSQKSKACEIWNLCKGLNAQQKIGHEFLSAAIADTRIKFETKMFWTGISFINQRQTVIKIFELYHALGFTEPLLTNMSMFGKDTKLPLLELVLYSGVFDDSSYTRTMFEYFAYLFYEKKAILFNVVEFPTTFGLVDRKAITITTMDNPLLPTDHTNRGILTRTLSKLRRSTNIGSEKRVSLSTMHKLLVIDTPVEVGGIFKFSRTSPDYTKIQDIKTLDSTVEIAAVSKVSSFGPITFHSHPLKAGQVWGLSLLWPSVVDIYTCMFNAIHEVLIHFVFTPEGVYFIKNNYLFLSFQHEFSNIFGIDEFDMFYSSYEKIVLRISLFLEDMRKKDNIIPHGLISHTRDNWIGYMNTLTLAELLPGTFVPKITPERKHLTEEMVNTNLIYPEFKDAIYYMQTFDEKMNDSKQLYFGTKMFRLPLYNLDFVPSELLGSHKTTSVLYSEHIENFK